MTRTLSDKNVAELDAHLQSGNGPEALKLSPPEKKRKRGNEESEIQKACIRWWATFCKRVGIQKEMLFSIPNGAVLGHGAVERSIRAGILKVEGMRPGVPDLFLAVSERHRNGDEQQPYIIYHGLFIEMKTERGPVSDDQVRMRALLEERGYKVEVCRSLEEFKKTVTTYFTS